MRCDELRVAVAFSIWLLTKDGIGEHCFLKYEL
jgi:hypothetical protein